jgi:uncharacterized damage-inducible protein DinB
MSVSETRTKLATEVEHEFGRYFRHLASRVDRAVRSIPRDKLWNKPYSYGNSMGHLVLHLTGNLHHYIGAGIAGADYVRDRNREFHDPEAYPPEEVLRRFHEAIEMVVRTVESLDDEGLLAPAPSDAPIQTRFGLLLVCAAHLNNHIGQMSYLLQAQGRNSQEPPVW